ncbi:hypothetical protein BD770DRAFT_462760 [Pilaira anomala]|nr:hypothetical protein BD770DRAFT_462760 [Pilaira anomala]
MPITQLTNEILTIIARLLNRRTRFNLARTNRELYVRMQNLPINTTFNIRDDARVDSFSFISTRRVILHLRPTAINYESIRRNLHSFSNIQTIEIRCPQIISLRTARRLLHTIPRYFVQPLQLIVASDSVVSFLEAVNIQRREDEIMVVERH